MKRPSFVRRSVFDGFTFAFLSMVFLTAAVRPTDDQLLALGFNATLAFLFFLLGAFLSYGLNEIVGLRTLGEAIFGSDQRKTLVEQKVWWKSFSIWQLLITLSVTLVVAFIKTEFSFNELFNRDGFDGALRLFHGLLHPNLNLLPRAVLNIIETIFMAFLATILAIPLAFLLSFFAAKNLVQGSFGFSFYLLLRTLLNVVRSVEALIWAIIFSVWVGIGPFSGMLALMVHSIASLTKQYSEMVEGVSEGPIDAIRSTGASKLQTIWFAIVPQVLLPYISFTVYRWDINVRMATVIGLVGGGGIGTMLIQYQGQAMWPEVGCIILVIAVVVWLMDSASAYLREALK